MEEVLRQPKVSKMSKGYRLKDSTHNLIRKLQDDLNWTQDRVISSALRRFNSHVKKNVIINHNKKLTMKKLKFFLIIFLILNSLPALSQDQETMQIKTVPIH